MDVPISIKVACALTELSQYFALKSSSKYMEYQQKERRMRATLISLQRLQQGRPDCAWVALHLEEARKQVQHMEDCHCQFRYHNCASRWTQIGDRCTKQFFVMLFITNERIFFQKKKNMKYNTLHIYEHTHTHNTYIHTTHT